MFANRSPSLILKNEVWEVDETMRARAEALVKKYTDQVGHVDLRHVVFVRVEGKKTDWLGKCFKLQPPHGILPMYAAFVLGSSGMLSPTSSSDLNELYEGLLDVQYIIAMNRDNVALIPKNQDRVIDLIILHELMHINPDMNKIVKHTSEDFKWLLKTFGVDWAQGEIIEEESIEVLNAVTRISRSDLGIPRIIDGTEEILDPVTGEVLTVPPMPTKQ